MAKPSSAQDARVSTLPPPTFSKWVPAAVVEAAERLYAQLASEQDPAKAEKVLSRLTSDPRMKRVWDELYKKKRFEHQATDEFLHAASVTNASHAAASRQRASELRKAGGADNQRDADLLEAEAAVLESEGDPPTDPRWSEQDRAAQFLLHHAYRAVLDFKPVFLSDVVANVNTLRSLAERLRKDAAILRSLDLELNARKLDEIASDCDEEAWNIDPSRLEPGDDPWIITRRTGDIRLKTFIIDLSIPTVSMFGKYLYSTLATVANVVFASNNVTHEKVREILRSPPGA
jgi:hypothetical protein